MKLYHKLAKYYDCFFQGSYDKEARVISNILRRLGVKGGLLLDVGCATGGHMKAFKGLGYEVEGLDESSEMIELARKKLPDAVFYKNKMQRARLYKYFDAITLLSRSLLFVRDEKELASLVNRLAEHLKHKGVLLIDLDLHKDFFNADKSDAHYFNNDGVEGSMIEEYDERKDKILWVVNLSISDHGRLVRRVDDQQFLKVSVKELLRLMREAGLKTIVYDMTGRAAKNYKQGLIIAGVKKKPITF